MQPFLTDRGGACTLERLPMPHELAHMPASDFSAPLEAMPGIVVLGIVLPR